MEDSSSIILALVPQNEQGNLLFGRKWNDVLTSFQSILQKNGSENDSSSDECMLLSYSNLFIALMEAVAGLQNLESEFPEELAQHPFPVKILLDYAHYHESGMPVYDADSDLWGLMDSGTIYLSGPLKADWEHLTAGKKIPPVTFEEVENTLFRLTFAAPDTPEPQFLLLFRNSLNQGDNKECFYCGLKNHPPRGCPSKYLTLDAVGLQDVGYISFRRLDKILEKMPANYQKISKILSEAISPQQIRKNDALQTFVAYFDIYKFYQLRFLFHVAFTLSSEWTEMLKNKKSSKSNNTLFLGLDCLRVQNYAQAERYLQESYHEGSTRFYATIGLAFLALEHNRMEDMLLRLEEAKSIAIQEKERIYISLLLSRCFEMKGRLWEAAKSHEDAMLLKPGNPEIMYRNFQLETKKRGGKESLELVHKLATEYKEIFMTVLLDPALIPLEAALQPLLAAHFFKLHTKAQSNLSRADASLENAKILLGADSQELAPSVESINQLIQHYNRKSYYDILDVISGADIEINVLNRIRLETLDSLRQKLSIASAKSQSFEDFWGKYPYKSFYKSFPDQLSSVKKRLVTIGSLMKVASDKNYKGALDILISAEKDLNRLKAHTGKMDTMKVVLQSMLSFFKCLALTMISVNLMVGIILIVNIALPSDSELAHTLSRPDTQKKIFLFANLLLSPLIALVYTLIRLAKSIAK